MTQDEIIRMAREAGLGAISEHYGFVPFNLFGEKELERFAALVAAHEREACAKVCAMMEWNGRSDEAIWKGDAADECAAAIRAINFEGDTGFRPVFEMIAEHKQAEQEPMYISESCAERGCACHYSVEVDGEPVTVYSAPVRTKDLTDDELNRLRHNIDWTADWSYVKFARAVIAADREKNK